MVLVLDRKSYLGGFIDESCILDQAKRGGGGWRNLVMCILKSELCQLPFRKWNSLEYYYEIMTHC